MRGSSISGLRRPSGNRRHPGGLGTLGALGDGVTHALAFLQAAETGRINGAVMDENVRTSVFGCDEAESLRVVEPLHCAVLHELPPRLDTNARARFPLHTPAEYAKQRCQLATFLFLQHFAQ